jgi:hypothetical protein
VALHEGRLFRNDGEAPSKGLTTKPRPVASGSSPCSALAHHTPRTGPRGRAVRRVLFELELAGARRLFGGPHRLVRERERNMSRMDS